MSVVRDAIFDLDRAEAYRGTFAPLDPALSPGDAVPPGWEGVYFPFAVPVADLRPDGTPARDGVVPETDLPRRMYAGEDTELLAPLHLGDAVRQTTSLGAVAEKSGASGRLLFVDIEREYAVGDAVAVRSTWHDVFLEKQRPGAPVREPRRAPDAVSAAEWVETTTLHIRHLFRFSALTFNTHRIHYDRAWAREVEGLPDLLVHGPLTRILLMDAARRHEPGRRPARLSVKAVAPTLVDREVRLAGRTGTGADGAVTTTVTAVDADDVLLATATVSWA